RSVETVGTIGETYTVDALDMTGFYFNGARTVIDGVSAPVTGNSVSATLGDEGMLIELYYDRIEYKYNVIYTNGATGEHILPKKESTGLFGEQIAEAAIDLKSYGYTLSSEGIKTVNISSNEENNVIEFVYLESVVAIKYQVIGPQGCGTLSRSSENVKAITGEPLGSMPIISKGYKFDGWYLDADCTIPVDPAMIEAETQKLTPTKSDDEIWRDNIEFFAKFLPNESKLTVIKSDWDPFDTEQAFIFTLKGVENTTTEKIDLTFTITGNSQCIIAALPVGEYTVTEHTGWSWRYTPDKSVKTVTVGVDEDENMVVFANSRTRTKWLDGNSVANNVFDN
ncbi:MAG: InlB B-repeat-containing protein, partial [Clostridia bacterium]|nr:InlB B-repeat-containing protein [Clostridia bacterium]